LRGVLRRLKRASGVIKMMRGKNKILKKSKPSLKRKGGERLTDLTGLIGPFKGRLLLLLPLFWQSKIC